MNEEENGVKNFYDQHIKSVLPIRFRVNPRHLGSGSASMKKLRSCEASLRKQWRAMDARNGDVEAQNWPWRVCRPVVTDWHHFVEEHDADADPDPHQGAKRDPDPHHKLCGSTTLYEAVENLYNWHFPLWVSYLQQQVPGQA
jgi:hypothetical protein